MRLIKQSIDLTDNRDFRDKNMTRGDHNRSLANNTVNTDDEFIARLYTSSYVNYLIDNMEKVCDRCGKYDYFNLMKTSLCNRCDEWMDEEFKVECFPTGDRKMIEAKKNNRVDNVERVWWL